MEKRQTNFFCEPIDCLTVFFFEQLVYEHQPDAEEFKTD